MALLLRGPLWAVLVGGCRAEAAAAAAAAAADASVLAQASVRTRRSGLFVSEAVAETPEGPMAYTPLGAVRGVQKSSYSVFMKIPYVEPPERFAVAQPRKPWVPSVLEATSFGTGCIGSHVPGVKESEDCLNLNIWLPTGGKRKMPVLVYFHGGMNQHGAGNEPARQGDLIVQSEKYPAIFVNFDFRMGIFGYYYDGTPDNSGIPRNLGLRDQQEALRWISKNIAAFGGDPNRVVLVGMSFGCPSILDHMVAPGSAGLFHRAVMVSPPADMWLRSTNELRTEFVVQESGCKRNKPENTVRCLKRIRAQKLWAGDWVSEDLSRDIGSPSFIHNALQLAKFVGSKHHIPAANIPGHLGWHVVVDGDTVPAEPRDLVAQGRWSKVPVLVTTARNETLGVFPGGDISLFVLNMTMDRLLGEPPTKDLVLEQYKESLARHGVGYKSILGITHALLTDKIWTCDIRSFANDIAASGGEVHVGTFAHAPLFDPVNSRTNKICSSGATCHSSDAAYFMPQGRDQGLSASTPEGWPDAAERLPAELAFSRAYSDYFLAFASGDAVPWKRWVAGEEAFTFIDSNQTRVVPGWRREQCDVLDRFMGASLSANMQRIGREAQVRLA